MFLGLLDPHPDPLFICMDPPPDPSINKQKVKKKLDLYCSVTSLWLFIFLKNDVNLSSKRNKHNNLRKKNIFCWCLEGHWRKEQDPDPLVKGTDPMIWIRTKMSRIERIRIPLVNAKTGSGYRSRKKNLNSVKNIRYFTPCVNWKCYSQC
jgi:hypothetical protein